MEHNDRFFAPRALEAPERERRIAEVVIARGAGMVRVEVHLPPSVLAGLAGTDASRISLELVGDAPEPGAALPATEAADGTADPAAPAPVPVPD